MNQLVKKYNSFVRGYREIEKETTENEIHDKRVTLRRIFPILAAYRIKPSKVKNGEEAFHLFGKLRDVQVQRLKLERIDRTPEITEYLVFLKKRELKLQGKVRKFCNRKKLKFPVLKKKSDIDNLRIVDKAGKMLNKLIARMHSGSIDDARDIHKIRIEFKKFRYVVEILSYIENIDEAKLEEMKLYQDRLGEIHDYEVLMDGIRKYFRKGKPNAEEIIEQFEKEQDRLIVGFENDIEACIVLCREVLIKKG
ncbi:MAG: CHAD domain-containing protein [Bacteroidota bacterium]|nr:CHAD domain-containing protein [Bacteroidota bacterium]